ncbi:Arc18p [Ascoidea rubescens DSM 1968]|uniref:Actin-related protein 2/3 complex subunit 3 n=1 Tax=Ascoidea rubescens DSM 1968 TaxID=1344418 RepID=A0A1D2VMP0_9ASCO|nr:ARP2/3 complex, 21 kDa p21-Arc subunit [Ascoidea rubescens DSM 1968]ODV62876.1 ARP2/3 complex, 21 kDa p21-Arc subunit [Ascoidea rubescens DSM 1968]
MPAYNSTFFSEEAESGRIVGNFAILPIRTKFRGPSYPTNSDYDIIDEVLDLFRPNSFFRNFEIKSNSDRTLIYGILYVSSCLNKLNKRITRGEAVRILNNFALEDFSVPGDPNFPLNAVFNGPQNRNDYDLLRGYIQQFRQELGDRLITILYKNDAPQPDKFWLAFSKRRFMNKSL